MGGTEKGREVVMYAEDNADFMDQSVKEEQRQLEEAAEAEQRQQREAERQAAAEAYKKGLALPADITPEQRAAMAAHATQATGAPDTVRTLAIFLALPEEIFAIAFSQEWFVLDPTSGAAAPKSEGSSSRA